MKLMSTYAVKIGRSADLRSTLSATAGICRKAVGFFIGVFDREWGAVSLHGQQTERVNSQDKGIRIRLFFRFRSREKLPRRNNKLHNGAPTFSKERR